MEEIIGLIAMSAKPYHVGHERLVRKASLECDRVMLYVSTSDRENVDGRKMQALWKECIERTLPSNVTVEYGGSPITKLYKLIENPADDCRYVIYTADPEKYPEKSLSKYASKLFNENRIVVKVLDRAGVSGTMVRSFMRDNDRDRFLDHVPRSIGSLMWKRLTEDYGGYGGDYAGLGIDTAMGGMPPFGAHFASEHQLYQAFIKPFVDIYDTAVGQTKELARRGLTLLATVFDAVKVTLVPVLKDRYEKIFEQEKEDLAKIRAEYASVYNSTWEAFKDPDVMIPAFMLRPDLFVTAKFIKDSPKVAAKTLSVLTGGKIDKYLKGSKEKVHKKHDHNPFLKKSKFHQQWNDMWTGMVSDVDTAYECVIREEKGDDKALVNRLLKIASDPRVHELIQSNPEVSQMSADAKKLIQKTLKTVLSNAEILAKASSLKELQDKLDIKIDGLDKLNKAPPNERAKLERELLDLVKSGMKETFIAELQSHVDHAKAVGIIDEHPYVKAYKAAIAKIKSM